jgi:hypothetical protein
MIPSLLCSISETTFDVGIPIRESSNEGYASWLGFAAAFLWQTFGTSPLWFAADREMARGWAYPEAIESTLGERCIRFNGVDYHIAYAERVEAHDFLEYVESVDFKTDSVLLVPAPRDAESNVHLAIAQAERMGRDETPRITVNVARSYADGMGILWLNHGYEPERLRRDVAEVADAYGFACDQLRSDSFGS